MYHSPSIIPLSSGTVKRTRKGLLHFVFSNLVPCLNLRYHQCNCSRRRDFSETESGILLRTIPTVAPVLSCMFGIVAARAVADEPSAKPAERPVAATVETTLETALA